MVDPMALVCQGDVYGLVPGALRALRRSDAHIVGGGLLSTAMSWWARHRRARRALLALGWWSASWQVDRIFPDH
jgi:hypothetical protein